MIEKPVKTIAEIYNNFRSDKPLAPDSKFRVERKDYNSQQATQMLDWAQDYDKWFLVGHRGCGKSTYLQYLLSLPEVKDKFHSVFFRISDVADESNLKYQDVLLNIVSQLESNAQELGALDSKLKDDVNNWGATIVKEVEDIEGAGINVRAGVEAFSFAGFALKLRRQHSTRKIYRTVVEPQITGLVELIDKLAEAIEQKVSKHVLVAIDDLDKISGTSETTQKSTAQEMFEDNWLNLTSPNCYIVYTVPISLMFTTAWNDISGREWYVPNVKIYHNGNRKKESSFGRKLMTEFIERRVNLGLLDEEALIKIITYGAGVFRQTCRLMQEAASHAYYRKANKITIEDVDVAIAEELNGLRPQLHSEDFEALAEVGRDNNSQLAYENPKLLHNLSLLVYPNENRWCDVNPILWKLVDEYSAKPA